MSTPVFIGDEISAAGFRMAGVRIRTPASDEVTQVMQWAVNNASVIMITPAYLAMLDDSMRHRLLNQITPPAVVIPDIRDESPVQDLATHLKAQLGMLEDTTDGGAA